MHDSAADAKDLLVTTFCILHVPYFADSVSLCSAAKSHTSQPIEFSLNVFTEFSKFSDKNICHYRKRALACHSATSCVRDQDATTGPARHMLEKGSLN